MMNINNSKYNYSRKFKAILKYVLFAVPLIMVLVAVLFPIKTTTNTYDGSISEVTESTSSLYFNQLVENGNFESTDGWSAMSGSLSVADNVATFTYSSGSYYGIRKTISGTLAHTYLISLCVQGYENLYLNWMGYNNTIATDLDTSDWNCVQSIFVSSTSQSLFQLFSTNETITVVYFKNIMLIDLTLMYGAGNEPSTVDEFSTVFPLDYYDYNTGELLMLTTISTTTTINDTDLIWYTEDTKTLNTTLLSPMVDFYDADINSWYESFLTAFELDYDTTSYMFYLVHMPLWIMYVVLLDLLLDIVLLVPCLLHRLVYKYKGDE